MLTKCVNIGIHAYWVTLSLMRKRKSLSFMETHQQEVCMHHGTVVVLPSLCNQGALLQWHGLGSEQKLSLQIELPFLCLPRCCHFFSLIFWIDLGICLFHLWLLQSPFLPETALSTCGNDGAWWLEAHVIGIKLSLPWGWPLCCLNFYGISAEEACDNLWLVSIQITGALTKLVHKLIVALF